MNKIRKIIMMTFIVLISLFTINVSAKEKVKVYIFEAKGCSYCTAQEEYLKDLSTRNDKFEVVIKTAYTDTATWGHAKDYDLAVNVVNGFLKKGFSPEGTTYQSTPLVVVGNKYAMAGLNTNLETVINTAYDEQQPDVVACYEKNEANCESNILDLNSDKAKETELNNQAQKNTKIILGLIVLAAAGLYLANISKNNNK